MLYPGRAAAPPTRNDVQHDLAATVRSAGLARCPAVKRSAGTLLYRSDPDAVRVLLVHMGGPFWARKDEHAWSVPKGEYVEGEDPHDVAAREFAEELGSALPDGPEIDLGVANQSGKSVTAYARAADFDATSCVSNTFETEWPPRSGRLQSFPEVDRAEWFAVDEARRRLVKGQVIFLDRLLARLGQSP
ncbi:MAG TPA: NUDIX domain-containing protein [Nakamurella sp.]